MSRAIVDKLLAKGYVGRQECPSNRRKMDITITDAGVALLKELNKKVPRLPPADGQKAERATNSKHSEH